MREHKKAEKEFILENVITSAIQIPGVKVNRNKFLAEIFASEVISVQNVIDLGPVQAGVSEENLSKLAKKLIIKRTSQSSLASFATGIPGGLAMAATIPADVLQFFGMALRLAQELSYLYGAEDLWQDGHVDDEKVKTQLLLYCGAMFGVCGAVSGVRILSIQLSQSATKQIPKRALNKEFWAPVIKHIGKAIGTKATKSTVTRGVSKVIPVIGGVISGGLNFASMLPMANRLQETLNSANFNYTDEEFEEDLYIIENIEDFEEETNKELQGFKSGIVGGGKKLGDNISGLFLKKSKSDDNATDDTVEKIKKISELKDLGIITEEEFEAKKQELLSQI